MISCNSTKSVLGGAPNNCPPIRKPTKFKSVLLYFKRFEEGFLKTIVTYDKTWVHHFVPENKLASMEW